MYLCNSRFVQCYIYNWLKLSTVYSKRVGCDEPWNLKNFPWSVAEFRILCLGIVKICCGEFWALFVEPLKLRPYGAIQICLLLLLLLLTSCIGR